MENCCLIEKDCNTELAVYGVENVAEIEGLDLGCKSKFDFADTFELFDGMDFARMFAEIVPASHKIAERLKDPFCFLLNPLHSIFTVNFRLKLSCKTRKNAQFDQFFLHSVRACLPSKALGQTEYVTAKRAAENLSARCYAALSFCLLRPRLN